MISSEHYNDFISMKIDDKGNFPSESDNNWIFITVKDDYVKKQTQENKTKIPKKVWNITEEQNWEKYNNDLDLNIGKIDKTTINTLSDTLIDIITSSMEKNIGKTQIGKTIKTKYPKPIIDLLKTKREIIKEF